MTFENMDTREGKNTAGVPLVSVIIAVYNKPEFLEKVFLSLVNQTFSNFEILVADDGSGPEIAECIARYARKFVRPVRHVRHGHDGFRKTVIANKAAGAATAEYLVFIDGDCVLHKKFLQSHFRHRARRTALGGRRVMLDKWITETMTNEDVSTGRFEKPWFWWNHCERGDRKHGLHVPGLFALSNLGKKGYSFYGSNYSLYKEDFCAVNGYDESIVGRGIEDDNLRERLKLNGVAVRSVTREAVQFHLFHESAPVPHSKEAIDKYCFPQQAWADKGIAAREGMTA
ncbi:MAG TPA: glycosyltransferase [Chitinivibrionales bacterium]|nr:glycosyltransferase [Chitinivibrionales bacterium]